MGGESIVLEGCFERFEAAVGVLGLLGIENIFSCCEFDFERGVGMEIIDAFLGYDLASIF
jgi:hypothetical protein